MEITNQFGFEWSGATPEQGQLLDLIIKDYFAYRLSVFPQLKTLCEDAPSFAMAHIFKGYLLLSMGTQSTFPAAENCADHVRNLSDHLTPNENLHLSALRAWINLDSELACYNWDMITIAEPRDLLAVKLQHFTLFWMGRPHHMMDVISRVLPNWRDNMPGYANLLGMQAFAHEEMGDYKKAESLGRMAVEMDPDDLWAVHAVAHVYEMKNDLDAGISWLDQPYGTWHDRNPFKDHLWWHTALFAFETGSYDRVLELYDTSIWPDDSSFYLDIQNSASMLARLEFAGVDVGDRWKSLAIKAQERNGDHVLLFTEPHYTMAFGSTAQFDHIENQIDSLETTMASRDDFAGRVTRDIAVPVCRAIEAFYQKNYPRVIELLWPIRYQYQPIGGSHAQRDIFNIFLIEAAIKTENFKMARALLLERKSRHHRSYSSQQRLDEVNLALMESISPYEDSNNYLYGYY